MKTLQLLGDKVRARALAMSAEVPIVLGSEKLDSKPILGGGGRGMRVVRKEEDLEEAFTRAQSEAEMCFGSKDIYYEEFVEFAKHVEVQIVSDGSKSIDPRGLFGSGEIPQNCGIGSFKTSSESFRKTSRVSS